jgi:hypothetical protein
MTGFGASSKIGNRYAVTRSGCLTQLKVFHEYDPLRSDPRFIELLKKVGSTNDGAKFLFANRVIREQPIAPSE